MFGFLVSALRTVVFGIGLYHVTKWCVETYTGAKVMVSFSRPDSHN